MGVAEKIYLLKEAKVWIKREKGPGYFISILPDMEDASEVFAYSLFVAYGQQPEPLGQILFDAMGYWIYNGDILSIAEQEQVAKFIINYQEKL
jgi:hypothetical protein